MSGPAWGSARDEVRELVDDALRLARSEVGMVKAEGMEAGRHGALGAGLMAGAALFAVLVLVCLLGAAAAAIGGALGMPWLGWLCAGFLALVIAGALAGVGYRVVRRAISEGKRVGSTLKEDLEWVRELPRHSANGS